MLVYILAAVFPFFVSLFYEGSVSKTNGKTTKFKRWLFLLLAAFPMFFLIGFRNQSIGADTINYLNHFLMIDQTDWTNIFDDTRMEYGYIVFVKIVGLITDSSLVYQLICAAIYLVSITVFANQLEKGNFLFLYFFATLGIYTFMFTGVRQCIAICICLLSYPFIKGRKLIPFVAMVLFAMLFHQSAVLFLAAYLIFNMKINIVNSIIYATITGVAFINIDIIQEWFNNQFEYNYAVESTGSGLVFLAILIIITVFSVVMLVTSKAGMTAEARGAANIGFIALVFWFLRLATRVAERPSYYFLFFSMAMLGYAVNTIKQKKERLIWCTLICTFSMALFIYRFIANFSTYVPYQFYSF